jgi:drug/metabolite transporter (DMT)-like permease
LTAGTAASVQLSVPLLAAIGAVSLLGESWTLRLSLAGAAILGGIALVVLARPAVPAAPAGQP